MHGFNHEFCFEGSPPGIRVHCCLLAPGGALTFPWRDGFLALIAYRVEVDYRQHKRDEAQDGDEDVDDVDACQRLW